MKKKTRKLIIFGNTNYAEMVCDYFTDYSHYKVVAFTVNEKYITGKYYYNHPLIPFEKIETLYPPKEYDLFIAVGSSQLNHVRASIFNQAIQKGYHLPTFVHPLAYVAPKVKIGQNCILMEFSKVLTRTMLGNNIIVWPSAFISHNCTIKDNAYLVGTVNGYAEVGENCFLGSGAIVADKIIVEKDNFIAMGAMIRVNTTPNSVYEGPAMQKRERVTALNFMKIIASKG